MKAKLVQAITLSVLLSALPPTASSLEFVFPNQSLTSGEVDLFDFEVNAGSFVALSTFDLVGPDADTILTLLDKGSGALIAENDDANDLASTIVLQLPAGHYTAAVSGFSNFFPFVTSDSDPGGYSLVIFGAGVIDASFDRSFVVPIPPAVALLASALLGLLSVRRARGRSD